MRPAPGRATHRLSASAYRPPSDRRPRAGRTGPRRPPSYEGWRRHRSWSRSYVGTQVAGSAGMIIKHLNPASAHANLAFSQGTVISAGSTIVIVGGQNGIGADGEVVGDTIGAQTEQATRNLIAVLAEAGATPRS